MWSTSSSVKRGAMSFAKPVLPVAVGMAASFAASMPFPAGRLATRLARRSRVGTNPRPPDRRRLDVASGVAVSSFAVPLLFDHVFTFVRDGGSEARLLEAAGLTVDERRVHRGQGTASRTVYFDGNFLELVDLHSRAEAEA